MIGMLRAATKTKATNRNVEQLEKCATYGILQAGKFFIFLKMTPKYYEKATFFSLQVSKLYDCKLEMATIAACMKSIMKDCNNNSEFCMNNIPIPNNPDAPDTMNYRICF